MSKNDTRIIAGCMTGTSLDGLDAALAVITGHGLSLRAHFVGMISRPLGDLRDELQHLASGGAGEPIRYLRAARRLGELHAEAIQMLCKQEGVERLDLAVAHGQTIWHAPHDRHASPDAGLSWQLFDPWPIVRRLNVAVCYDLRQADLIAGGQGAPITPMSDWVVYRHPGRTRLIANLGGVLNVTLLPGESGPEAVTGGDVGPCNLLLDGLVRRLFPGRSYDTGGEIARRGTPHPQFLEWVKLVPFFQRPWPRSTGREDFTDPWLDSLVERGRVMGWSNEDILASAVDAVAALLAEQSGKLGCEIILAGGGARNKTLTDTIRRRDPRAMVRFSDELHVPCEAREALGFAVLGALAQDGVPITLPRVTGSEKPGRSGVWVYP